MINVFNMYMKKKAVDDDDLMFSTPPELLLLQVFTQLDFVDHLFIENNGHRPHFRKKFLPHLLWLWVEQRVCSVVAMGHTWRVGWEVVSRIERLYQELERNVNSFFVVWADLITMVRKHHHVDKVLHVGHLKVILRWSRCQVSRDSQGGKDDQDDQDVHYS